jgi:uncharacterized protein YjbJ (UPF0337 family)
LDTPEQQRGKGIVDRTVGKVKEETGELTGNRSLEAKGRLQGAKGKVEEKVGELREE